MRGFRTNTTEVWGNEEGKMITSVVGPEEGSEVGGKVLLISGGDDAKDHSKARTIRHHTGHSFEIEGGRGFEERGDSDTIDTKCDLRLEFR